MTDTWEVWLEMVDNMSIARQERELTRLGEDSIPSTVARSVIIDRIYDRIGQNDALGPNFDGFFDLCYWDQKAETVPWVCGGD